MNNKDITHLEWVYERMKFVHNENPHVDYMIKFRKIIDELRQSTTNRVALVTPDNDWGVEEWYIHVIECPKCKHTLPAKHAKYCSGCGIELKLSKTVQDYVKNGPR